MVLCLFFQRQSFQQNIPEIIIVIGSGIVLLDSAGSTKVPTSVIPIKCNFDNTTHEKACQLEIRYSDPVWLM